MKNGMEKGLRGVANRMVNAEERFLSVLMTLGGIERDAAGRVLAQYRKFKLVKMDAVGGVMNVKHGALLDRDTIQKAAAQ